MLSVADFYANYQPSLLCFRARSTSSFVQDPHFSFAGRALRATDYGNSRSLREKSPSAACIRSCPYEREESRDYAEMLLDNSRTYNYDNELMCYRLNEKRNIQALSSESQLISSFPFTSPPYLIVVFYLPHLSFIRSPIASSLSTARYQRECNRNVARLNSR